MYITIFGYTQNWWLGVLAGIGISALLGAGKELWDKLCKRTPDIWDFVATVSGGVVGAGLTALLYH
jgi:hypothetical protein